jgi:hypothetical protein
MIRRFVSLVAVAVATLAISLPAAAFVGQLAVGLGEMEERGRVEVAFSGDATFETDEMSTKARVHYSPGKVRDEIRMEGQEMVVIRRFDLNKLWMLMGHGMYMDIAPDEMDEKSPEYRLVSRDKIGREKVNGMETTKYKSVYETSEGRFEGFTWFTDDNIAVKAQMVHQSKGEKHRMKFEFTRLERGRQDDSLFELPPGVKPFSMGSMMSGFGQAPDQSSSPDQGTGSGDGASGEETDFAGQVVDEAQESAMEATIRGVGDSVSKGIGKLFGK